MKNILSYFKKIRTFVEETWKEFKPVLKEVIFEMMAKSLVTYAWRYRKYLISLILFVRSYFD